MGSSAEEVLRGRAEVVSGEGELREDQQSRVCLLDGLCVALSLHASTNPEVEARHSFRDGLRLFRLPSRIVHNLQEFLAPEGNRDAFDPEEQLVGLWGRVWLRSSDQRTRASAFGPTKCNGGSPRRNRSTSSTALAPSR